MNKTIDISLGGILFHLDETAYYKLKKYLKSVKASLKGTEDVNEVMNEIEARIAELLLEKQSHPQQVINEQNIDEIISIMGQPEDFEEEIDTSISGATTRVKKGLFRDMDKSVIGGVAAGLGHYLGIDITIMRLIFIILLFVTHGSIILIYLLLWIVIPKAKTASDKLRMKGEKVDVDSIVDQVSTEEDPTKKKIKIGEKVEDTSKELGNVIVKILGLLIILVTGAILTGLAISIVSLLPFAHADFVIPGMPFQDIVGASTGWIAIVSILLIGIPFALLFLLGFKMLFPNTKSLNKNVFIVAGTIWFLSLVFVAGKTTSIMAHKHTKRKALLAQINWPKAGDTLQIINQELLDSIPDNYISISKVRYIFYPSTDSAYHIKIFGISEGINQKEAVKNARQIKYKLLQDSLKSRLVFSKNIMYPVKNMVSERQLEVRIYVPENAKIKLSENISYHSINLPSDYPEYIQNKAGKIIVLKDYEEHITKAREESLHINGKDVKIKINDDGIDVYSQDDKNNAAHISIDEEGIKIKTKEKDGDATTLQLDEQGINIKTNKDDQQRNR